MTRKHNHVTIRPLDMEVLPDKPSGSVEVMVSLSVPISLEYDEETTWEQVREDAIENLADHPAMYSRDASTIGGYVDEVIYLSVEP